LPPVLPCTEDGRVPAAPDLELRRTLGPGELARLAYRLGRQAASGVLTLQARAGGARPGDRPGERAEVFVLRRGGAIAGDGEHARRALISRLARAAAEPSLAAKFDGGVTAYPPGATAQVQLAEWARSHLEAQLDGGLADAMVRELTGARMAVRAELAPAPIDEADRRMIAALTEPRRLDQIWPLARTPRFRLLAFLHFLRSIGALTVEGVAAGNHVAAGHPGPASAGHAGRAAAGSAAGYAAARVRAIDPRRVAAMRLLGVEDASDLDAVKRAYRRLARALHPDLQPGADATRRRALERRFAEVTAAYDALTG
jgi:hypothetical protein